MADQGSLSAETRVKDPRIKARKYQLELCKKAVEENVIVYLGTGCGKTHIAVLLIYELAHLIRKPQRNVCVFLAPTVPLVLQQTKVIEESTEFKVRSYFGGSKRLNHQEWEKEIEEYEVFVMTPELLLQNLHHCFIRIELIALLIFDECHHAQSRSSHPYAQIMKEFYRTSSSNRPRIFGMTASPVVGKGGPNEENLPKSINSLESILDAKVYSVQDEDELEKFVASPEVKFYYYGAVENTTSNYNGICVEKLEDIKGECISMLRKKAVDLCIVRNSIKLLQRLHDNLIFCLESLGCWGATQAIRILLSSDQADRTEMIDTEGISNGNSLADQYLTQASTIFGYDFMKDGNGSSSSRTECLEEPLVSKKLLVLIRLLSTCRSHPDRKCIIFVNRIIVARALSYILGKFKCLEFWKCHYLVGFHSGLKSMSRKNMDAVVEKFRNGELNLLIATKVGEEGLDIQTCGLVIRFDLPDTVASFIQSRGRARMPQSEYAFLVDRGNHNELSLINSFMSDEDRMNKEISCRTSREAFDDFEEAIYKVGSTGASTSARYSVSLLHRYCSKLSHDDYFNPRPEFYYVDDLNGTVCHLILPSNAPIHEFVSLPHASKENAKRDACLKACKELHLLGALTGFLLPGQANEVNEGLAESKSCEDESSPELHEMLSPAALKAPWNISETSVLLNFYFIRFVPVPEDRSYQQFGLFVKAPLPREVGNMQLDLHLLHGRIVKSQLVPSGTIELDDNEILQAQNFQEMFLKIILDRSDFFSDFISLGTTDSSQPSSSTFYLLLPVKQNDLMDKLSIDWKVIRRCLSSAVFRTQTDDLASDSIPANDLLQLSNGPTTMRNIVNSLVFTPHCKKFYFIDEILHGTDAETSFTDHSRQNYTEHYSNKFGIQLLYPKQPLLKAKQLFCLRNLLCNRIPESRVKAEARELEEHFVELPPELCTLKIIGFSKDIGSSLSLLPSIMHRVENLLLAIELKDIFSTSFPEGFDITAEHVLEALTTEKCLERFSLERLEVLGDAFLKYAVGRHLFLFNEALDEGQLTRKRSAIVRNSHLYTLAIRRNLQVYIRDQFFDPCQFFAFGRPCKLICTKDTETTFHSPEEFENAEDGAVTNNLKCSKGHHWLQKKTIADVVEALVGAFIVDSGFKGATAFLKWIGIAVDFNASQVAKVCAESDNYLALNGLVDTAKLENLLGYRFFHKGLLLQAFIHPSYNKHSGGCYQRLEFLGDAVLDYLITSYLYSVYPKLKPGQLTDLRSVAVNNNSFARIAVCRSFHEYLICDSDCLSEAIREFAHYIQTSASGKDLIEGPTCPKVLGDLVESSVGAMLLDTGFNLNHIWKTMLSFFGPIISFSSLPLNPLRELQELCQYHKWEVKFLSSEKRGTFLVEAEVMVDGIQFTSSASNFSKKTATKAAAQDILSALQARGYKVKSKSLEEILKSSIKHEAKLIGYDETPTRVVSAESILLENLHIQFPSPAPKHTTSNSKAVYKERHKIHHPNKYKSPSKVPKMDCGEGSEEGSCGIASKVGGLPYKSSARSRLNGICTINYWNPPLFECCSEEGPSHLRLFTYKVTVEIKEASDTVLECFGDPRALKKAAAEHAAEGALWYLQNNGYIAKSD